MKNNSFNEILKKIKSSKKILLSLHNGPDGDSFGSCASMKYFLEKYLNKKVSLISPDILDGNFEMFNFYNEIEFGKSVKDFSSSDFDLLISLDAGSASMLNIIKENAPFTINLDHHHTNNYYGEMNYVDSSRPSCCSVLLDFFKSIKIKIDSNLATRLLLGIYTDTGDFSHDGGISLKEGSFLIDCGADYKKIVDILKYNIPLNVKKYFALITNNFRIEKFEKYNIGVSSTSYAEIKNLNLSLADVRGGVNYLQEIAGLDFLFTITEIDDCIKGSFRSRKNIDVSLFAKELGGGGHKLAAAFKSPKMSIAEAEKKVFGAIKKVGVHKAE